ETDLFVVDGAAAFSAVDDPKGTPLLLKEGDSARIEPDQLPRVGTEPPAGLHYVENLRDRVIKYDATIRADGFADELQSVTVQRGGRVRVYARDQLTQGRLTQFVSRVNAAVCTTHQGEGLPE